MDNTLKHTLNRLALLMHARGELDCADLTVRTLLRFVPVERMSEMNEALEAAGVPRGGAMRPQRRNVIEHIDEVFGWTELAQAVPQPQGPEGGTPVALTPVKDAAVG